MTKARGGRKHKARQQSHSSFITTRGICGHTGKMRFTSRGDAKSFARKRQMRDLSAYRCTICNDWHLGHLPKQVENGDAARYKMQPRLGGGQGDGVARA